MKISSKLNKLKPTDLNCNVFDVYSYDGLSMQDLLCQFFTKINECIKVSNETIDLASWLVNEGLKIEVVKKLMLWLEDGTLENLINVNLFNTLNTKIDNISTQLAYNTNAITVVNVRNFGAKCDGITNDTEAFNKAIQSLPQNGGIVEFDCNCLIDFVDTHPNYLIKIDRMITLRGVGFNSKLIVGENIKNDTDIIYISPLKYSGFKVFWGLENFEIDYRVRGMGNHAIHIELLEPTQYVAKMIIQKISIHQPGGKCIKLTNPTNQDGFFTSTICDNYFNGGLYFERIGDSVNINRNTITGNDTGIEFTMVPSARMVVIENNNITANPAINVIDGGQIKIIYNQIEQVLPSTSESMITLGSTRKGVGYVEVYGNNLNSHYNINNCIKIVKGLNCKIDENYMFESISNVIDIDENSSGTIIGGNNFLENKNNTGHLDLQKYINDRGNGTKGVKKVLTPLNEWVDADLTSHKNIEIIKDSNNMVTISGNLKGGITTHGTKILELPVGFRPVKAHTFQILNSNLGVLQMIQLTVTVTGNVILIGNNIGNTFVNLTGISFYTI